VGSQVAEIVLDKDLEAGTYPALLTVHMVEEDGAEVESNMGFNITLIVEN
jgi:methionine-rich copper-binding protein CopC